MKSIQIEESKLRFLLENKTKKEVAELFGCCVETLRKRCLEYGIESDKPEYNIEIVKALFSEKGCELLETEYINNKHPMNYRCVCGTLSKIQLNKFLSGQRCKECKRRKFIGENNHKWNPNKTDDDRKEDRKYFEYIQWTKQVMARDGYICQICKKHTDLNVHHLYSYDKHVDKRLDPDNGISLCESCHKLFHQKYGYGNNTREQFINQFLFHLNEISEFEFTNVTEKCALDVYDFLGCGNSKEIDRVATDSIRVSLNNILFSGRVVLCEGEKDGSFGLFNEKVGKIDVPCLDIDIVCDPVDGSTRSSNYQADACCILCLASKGCFYIPKTHYMKKLVMRENLYMTLDKTNLLEVPVKELAKNISEVLQRKPIVSLLRRERNQFYIDEFRRAGCVVKLIDDCDVFGSIRATDDIDLFYGIGGATETILATSALASMGGYIEAQEVDKNWKEVSDIMKNDALVKGWTVFIATGVTDGIKLRGVRKQSGKTITNTLFTSTIETDTIREITTYH